MPAGPAPMIATFGGAIRMRVMRAAALVGRGEAAMGRGGGEADGLCASV